MTIALVYVNCTSGEQLNAEKRVRHVYGVTEAYVTNGAYDMILKVKAETEPELLEVIKAIKGTSGVGSAITSIVL
jgi:hypothetical protein